MARDGDGLQGDIHVVIELAWVFGGFLRHDQDRYIARGPAQVFI